MADVKKVPDTPGRNPQPAPKTRLVTLILRDLPDPSKRDDGLGNRFLEKYQAANLEDLLDSIRLHGLFDPPVVVKGKDGKWRIVSGHRRVAALYVLAARSTAGFSTDMPVPCLELLDASNLQLVLHSISANELGKKLDAKERLGAVQKASAAGATKKEIAATVGVSETAVERDLKIVKDQRIFQHVLDDHLPPTAAAALVTVASARGRLDEFLAHFGTWVQATKRQIDEEDARAKQERGRGLRPSQMLVANRLEPHVVRGWLDELARGRPLAEGPDLGFEAAFDRKTAVATIRVKVNAMNDDPDHVARVAGQVSQIAKHLAAFAQKRRELEGPTGPQAALQQDDSLLDKELLAEYGLEDVADQLERELRAEEQAAEETPPEQQQEEPTEGE
jgi:ParB-like chromosome segregation protein Spo0J